MPDFKSRDWAKDGEKYAALARQFGPQQTTVQLVSDIASHRVFRERQRVLPEHQTVKNLGERKARC